MHTEFPYWLRWKNFTYRSVLSRSAFRVHPRFLRDDSLIFRGVLTPFCTTTVCLFVLWLIHSAYVWACALTVSLVAIFLTCVWGWQRYAWCFSHIVVWIVHYVYGCMNEIKFQVCTGPMFNVGFSLNSFANKQGTSNVNKLKHSYYHSSFIVVY